MKKTLLVLFLLFGMFGTTNAFAGPKWSAIPRAVGRTIKTMALPWTDKTQAFRDYLIVAAVFVDAASTRRVLINDPFACEKSPLLPCRPSVGRYWAEMAPLAIAEATLVTAAHEDSINHPWKHAKLGRILEPDITEGILLAPHIYNITSNFRFYPDAAELERLSQFYEGRGR